MININIFGFMRTKTITWYKWYSETTLLKSQFWWERVPCNHILLHEGENIILNRTGVIDTEILKGVNVLDMNINICNFS
jgi:hypothetical protein